MDGPRATWRPILSGGERARALDVVATIAADLRARYGTSSLESDPGAWSLGRGGTGVALFFAYLGETLGDDDARAMATRLIEEGLDATAGGTQAAGQYAGFSGIAWTLAHLDGSLFDLSDGDPNDAVDGARWNYSKRRRGRLRTT